MATSFILSIGMVYKLIKQKIKLPEKKEMIEWIKLKDLEQKSNNLDYFDLTYDSISYLKNLRIL